MASVEINPWSAKIVEDFLYFCCPECDVKDQFKDSFIQHALENHPNSRENFLSCVKIEIPDEENCVDTLFLEAQSEDLFQDFKVEESNVIQNDIVNQDFIENRENISNEDSKLVDVKKENNTVPENIGNEPDSIKVSNIQSQESDQFSNQSRVAKEYKCKFENCNENFKSDHKRYLHYKNIHGDLGDHVCNECKSSFYTKYLLSSHIERVHRNGNDTHLCNVCGKTFDQKKKLTAHYKTVHLRVHHKIAVCDQCGLEFKTKGNLDGPFRNEELQM